MSDWSLAQMFHVSPGSTCDLLAKFLRDMAVFSCFAFFIDDLFQALDQIIFVLGACFGTAVFVLQL